MSNFSFETHGFAELLESMQGLGGVAEGKLMASAARSSMRPALALAKTLCPYDPDGSSHLRDSLRLAARVEGQGSDNAVEAGIVAKRGKITGEIEIADGETVPFVTHWAGWRWHFAEFGTAHSAAHPFLRPAFDQTNSQVLDQLQTRMAKLVERAWKRQALQVES